MSLWLAAWLLALGMISVETASADLCLEPGAAAPDAYRFLSGEAEVAACAAFFEQIENGIQNPWSYRGAAYCAVGKPELRARLFSILERPVAKSFAPLTLGYLRLLEEDHGPARELLLRAVEHAGSRSSAWNALGTMASRLEQPEAAVAYFKRALEACPDLDILKHDLAAAQTSHSIDLQKVDPQRALLGLEAAYELFKEVEDLEEIARTSYEMGITLQDLGELDAALVRFEKTRFLLKVMHYQNARIRNYSGGWITEIPEFLFNEFGSVQFAPLSTKSPHNKQGRQYGDGIGRFTNLSLGPNFGIGGSRTETRLRFEDKYYEIPESQPLGFLFGLLPGFPSPEEVLLQEAQIYEQKSQYRKALFAYQSASGVIFGSGVIPPRVQALALAGEASVLLHRGEYEDARWAYRKARDLFGEAGHIVQQGRTWNGEGFVLLALEEALPALKAFRNGREILSAAESAGGRGHAIRGEAQAWLLFEDYQTALTGFRESRRWFTLAGDPRGIGATWVGEAEALLGKGDREGASAAFEEAHRLFEDVGDELESSKLLLRESSLLLEAGFARDAAEAAARARPFLRQQELTPLLLRSLLLESRARRRLGEIDLAVEPAREAIDLHASYRKIFVTDEQRSRIDLSISPAYEFLVARAFHNQDFEGALTLAERSRSRVLLDLMTGHPLKSEKELPELEEEYRRLQADLAKVGEDLRVASDPDTRRRLIGFRSFMDLDLRQNLYHQISSRHHEGFSSRVEIGEALQAAEIHAIARETGPILYYHVIEEAVLAFLALPSSPTLIARSIPIAREELSEILDRFLYDLGNRPPDEIPREQAEALWQILVEPIQSHLPPSGPLTIVPHGLLHSLPFEALVDPETGGWLFGRWDVSLTPSMSVRDIARRKRHRASLPYDTLVVFSVVKGSPLATEDLRQIARLFPEPRRKLFGPARAEFTFYDQNAPQARHLLISTMGVYTPESRRETYLEILPTPGVHDARLSAAEIAAIPLSAELVTLAACDTDRGEAPLSDDRLTLTRSFLIAGASAVLATRWRIPDNQSTRQFLIDFYQAYRTPSTRRERRRHIAFTAARRKDEAITLARHRAIERGEPPQVWAAWVLVGDPR